MDQLVHPVPRIPHFALHHNLNDNAATFFDHSTGLKHAHTYFGFKFAARAARRSQPWLQYGRRARHAQAVCLNRRPAILQRSQRRSA